MSLNIPADRKYSTSDEWVRVEGDELVIGISDFAQDALGDIVYLELPKVGDTLAPGAAFGAIESVKASSD
ncbi:MAG: glycine cleavage system protein H, partial [Chloroflexales bacterium]